MFQSGRLKRFRSVISRVKAPNNLQQSASSQYGSYSGGGSSSCFKLDICPDLLLAGLVAAFAAIFYLLHTAITMKGRKKRRAMSFYSRDVFQAKFLWDLVNYGMSPFKEPFGRRSKKSKRPRCKSTLELYLKTCNLLYVQITQ